MHQAAEYPQRRRPRPLYQGTGVCPRLTALVCSATGHPAHPPGVRSMKRHDSCTCHRCALLVPFAAVTLPPRRAAGQRRSRTTMPAQATRRPRRSARGQRLQAVTVTARRRSERLENVPVAVSAFSAEDLQGPAGDQYRRTAGRGAEHEHRAGTRLVQQRQHLHPRHRPAGCAADLRSRRRHLCRRRLLLAHPGRAVQPVRCRPGRSPARPAGHAVRQELAPAARSRWSPGTPATIRKARSN